MSHLSPPNPATSEAFRVERVRLHADSVIASVLASAVLGLVLVGVLWGAAPPALLLGWLACHAGSLALRLAVRAAHWRSSSAEPALWLLRYRLVTGLHGAVWGLAGLLFMDGLDHEHFDLLLFALTAVTAGSLIATAFDMVAASLFAIPALAPALVKMVLDADAEAHGPALGLLVLIFVGVTLIGVHRAQRTAVEATMLRLAEAARADEARHLADAADAARRELAEKHHLLSLLLRTTQQGFWFIDTEGRTTDLNPAMCALLGRPREDVIGRLAVDFFQGADRETLTREVASRAGGRTGAYEIGIERPDGTRLHCLSNATPIYGTQGQRLGSVGIWTDLTARREAEIALRTYEVVVNSITDLVSVVSEDWIYRMVNDAWCRRTGVTREQALGRSTMELLPSLATPQRRAAMRECVESREPRVVRGSADGPGLSGRLLETTYYPYADASSGVRRVVLVTRDVTEQEASRTALRASEAEWRAVLEAFPGYIAAADQNQVYTYVNDRLAKQLGGTAESITGRHLREVLGEERFRINEAELAQVRAGGRVSYTRSFGGHDGQPRVDLDVTLVAGPRRLDGRQIIYGFGIDVTARRLAEDALIAARDDAERANRAKSQFLSQMSHELRTPLNAILGFAQLLESDPVHPLQPVQQGHVDEILRGARHLLELINEVLDLGRIEAGRLELQCVRVPLGGLVDDCIALMQPLAAAHGVRVLAPAGPSLRHGAVRADRMRLKQVLLNLLGNAIKYNRRDGEVVLEGRVDGGHVVISVRDSGRGLTAAEQQRLFQPFERLDAARDGIEGTGIGLALSRRLVEAMEGSIGVDSVVGSGSTFWVRLPEAEADIRVAGVGAPDAAPVGPPAPGATPRTVLYIEDNPVNVLLMEAMLSRLPGITLVAAGLPQDGLDMAARMQPALVLLDIHLPGIDGFEVLARLRADPATRHIPVLAVSANAMQADIEAAVQAGFQGYLTKPLELDPLLAAVRRVLAASPAVGSPQHA